MRLLALGPGPDLTIDLEEVTWKDPWGKGLDTDQLTAQARGFFAPPRPTHGLVRSTRSGLGSFMQCAEVRFTQWIAALAENRAALESVNQAIRDTFPSTAAGTAALASSSNFVVFSDLGVMASDTLDVLEDALALVKEESPDWVPDVPMHIRLCALAARGMTCPKVNLAEPTKSTDRPIILFNQELWNGNTPQYRLSVAAHEIFHQLQYARNFRMYDVPMRHAWFSEGTASWMEYQAQGLTDPEKLLASASHPNIGLLNASYYAFPFWVIRCPYKHDMGKVLRLYEGSHGNLDKLTDLKYMEKYWRASLKRRLLRTFPPVRAAEGTTVSDVDVTFQPKKLFLPTGQQEIVIGGALPRFGNEIFEVPANAANLELDVREELEAEFYIISNPSSNSPVDKKEVRNLQPPFRIMLTAPGSPHAGLGEIHPYLLRLTRSGLQTSSAQPLPFVAPAKQVVPGSPTDCEVALDALGNILITHLNPSSPDKGKSVIGYCIDGYASIGVDNPSQPAQYAPWYSGELDANGRAIVQLAAPFSGGFSTVSRSVSLVTSLQTVEITIETEISGDPSRYETMLLCGGPTTTPDDLYQKDGGEGRTCSAGGSCDGNSSPLWFDGCYPNGSTTRQSAKSVVVPFPGKVLAALDLGTSTGTRTMKEVYFVPLSV